MPAAWHPIRWWNFCISEDEKKEREPTLTEGLKKMCVGSTQYGDIETFCLQRY